jgi:hypothetical protein
MYIWQKAKYIYKRQPHLLVREEVSYELLLQEYSWKNSGRGSRGTRRQYDLIGSKPLVIK